MDKAVQKECSKINGWHCPPTNWHRYEESTIYRSSLQETTYGRSVHLYHSLLIFSIYVNISCLYHFHHFHSCSISLDGGLWTVHPYLYLHLDSKHLSYDRNIYINCTLNCTYLENNLHFHPFSIYLCFSPGLGSVFGSAHINETTANHQQVAAQCTAQLAHGGPGPETWYDIDQEWPMTPIARAGLKFQLKWLQYVAMSGNHVISVFFFLMSGQEKRTLSLRSCCLRSSKNWLNTCQNSPHEG